MQVVFVCGIFFVLWCWQCMFICCIVESVFFIVWSCFEQSGEFDFFDESVNVIFDVIEVQFRIGEWWQLMLVNRVIDVYCVYWGVCCFDYDCIVCWG